MALLNPQLKDGGIHTFPNSFSSILSVMDILEFKLAYISKFNTLATKPRGHHKINRKKYCKQAISCNN